MRRDRICGRVVERVRCCLVEPARVPRSLLGSQRRVGITTSLNPTPLLPQMSGRSSGHRCVRSNSRPVSRAWLESWPSSTGFGEPTPSILEVPSLSARPMSLRCGTNVFTLEPSPLDLPWRPQRSTDGREPQPEPVERSRRGRTWQRPTSVSPSGSPDPTRRRPQVGALRVR